MRHWLKRHRLHILLFVVGLVVYSAFAADRLRRQSTDPHYIYLASAWLRGKIEIDPPPTRGDDWAQIHDVRLRDSNELVRGRWLAKPAYVVGDPWLHSLLVNPRRNPTGSFGSVRFFRTTDGRDIPESQIGQVQASRTYVSFPPVPALLMLPSVLIHGDIANDVFPTLLVAALVLPLCFAALRSLSNRGLSQRSVADDLWLVACMGFGTVFFYSAVQGRVWYTAHVCAVALVFGYLWASLEARHPLTSGLCLGLAALTRPTTAFLFPFFIFEVNRRFGWSRSALRHVLWFAAPVVALAAAAMVYNHWRFDSAFEFGHSYLKNARQLPQLDEYGLFNYHYLSRNLSVALSLLPQFTDSWPFIRMSQHGMALWITTPLFVLLLWPHKRTEIFWPLVVSIACAAIPILLYQNSGRVQFGYRFSLDYTPLLLLLFATSGRPLSRTAKGLIIAGIAINVFGASFYHRTYEFYDTSNFEVVIPH